jgi:hypothetical protein
MVHSDKSSFVRNFKRWKAFDPTTSIGFDRNERPIKAVGSPFKASEGIYNIKCFIKNRYFYGITRFSTPKLQKNYQLDLKIFKQLFFASLQSHLWAYKAIHWRFSLYSPNCTKVYVFRMERKVSLFFG